MLPRHALCQPDRVVDGARGAVIVQKANAAVAGTQGVAVAVGIEGDVEVDPVLTHISFHNDGRALIARLLHNFKGVAEGREGRQRWSYVRRERVSA